MYELIRLYLLMKNGMPEFSAPISWYAAIPLLAVVPVLFFFLSANEEEHRLYLPIVTLIKGAGIPALILFIVQTLPTALRFGTGSDGILIKSIITALLFILGDTVIGVYCFGRSRILCK